MESVLFGVPLVYDSIPSWSYPAAPSYSFSGAGSLSNASLSIGSVNAAPANTVYCYTGMGEELAEIPTAVYPNPCTGIFTIDAGNEKMNAAVYDVMGRQVYSIMLTAGTNTIHMDNAAPGAYLLRLEKSNGEVEIKKMILQ